MLSIRKSVIKKERDIYYLSLVEQLCLNSIKLIIMSSLLLDYYPVSFYSNDELDDLKVFEDNKKNDLLLNRDFTHAIVQTFKAEYQNYDKFEKLRLLRKGFDQARILNNQFNSEKMHWRKMPYYLQEEKEKENLHFALLIDLSSFSLATQKKFEAFYKSVFEGNENPNAFKIGKCSIDILQNYYDDIYDKKIGYHSKVSKILKTDYLFKKGSESMYFEFTYPLREKLKKLASQQGQKLNCIL